MKAMFLILFYKSAYKMGWGKEARPPGGGRMMAMPPGSRTQEATGMLSVFHSIPALLGKF